MILNYLNKKSKETILSDNNYVKFTNKNNNGSKNKLFWGENLFAMKYLLFDLNLKGKIDLIYTDPPFATNNDFKIGPHRANSISASFEDEVAYSDKLVGAEYLEFIRERLILMKELLSDRGSIYLHIDNKIGHYVKIIMDEVFGFDNFINDITRIKCNPKNFDRKAFGNIKDLILFYSKSGNYIWNEQRERIGRDKLEKLFKKKDKNGNKYTTIPLHAPGETRNGPTGQEWRGIKPPKGRHWRSSPEILNELEQKGLIEWSKNGIPRKIIYAHDAEHNGKKIQDIWEFKDSQQPLYPTEKNIDLVNLIIKTSSKEGSIVLDPFSGSGTTIIAATNLNRNWIGIDQTHHSINIIKKRLNELNPNFFSNHEYTFYEQSDSKQNENSINNF